MAKDLTTYPVMKNGKFIGYADAEQIANNKSLELYDETKAANLKAQAAVEAASAAEAKKVEQKVEATKAGGADASAVKKGPAK